VQVNDLGSFTVINGQLFPFSAHDSIRINGGNTMFGNGALALIYTDGNDTITGFDPNSRTVPITP
jgi:hypothetical protein